MRDDKNIQNESGFFSVPAGNLLFTFVEINSVTYFDNDSFFLIF